MKLVTVATHEDGYFKWLLESVKRFNCEKDFVVLGYGEEWQGFTWRFLKMLEYLKTLNEDEVVCFCDGYDVIAIRDLKELEESFKSFKKIKKSLNQDFKIMVSSEKYRHS